MKVIIIEDEKLSAEHLETLLRKTDASIQVIAVYDSVKRAVEAFTKGTDAELLLVDVHLADGLSFEIFSKVKINTPVIFTTAYDEYAIQAFKLNSVDYLLKPIAIKELGAAIEKYKRNKNTIPKEITERLLDSLESAGRKTKNRFMVKMGDSLISVKSEEISHFIAEDGIVLLITKAGKRYPVDYTLDQLEEITDPNSFFRINRKVIIGIDNIQKVSSYFNGRLKINSTILTEEDSIVSRERVADFKQWLDK